MSTQKVSDYKMIADDNTERFNQTVNRALKEGWSLYGHPFPAHEGSTTFYSQAVVRYEDNSIGPDITVV